jgi:hypothetical protein
MKPIFLALLGGLLLATGCTYTTVQQQNGVRHGNQLAIVGGGGNHAVTAYQGTDDRPYYPTSTYPEYNGYPGSGSRSGYPYDHSGYAGGPTYPPDDGGTPYPSRSCQPVVHAEINLY